MSPVPNEIRPGFDPTARRHPEFLWKGGETNRFRYESGSRVTRWLWAARYRCLVGEEEGELSGPATVLDVYFNI